MCGAEFIGRFACEDDQTPEATDAEMAQVFGSNWQKMTYGEQRTRLNELLKPKGQWFELPKDMSPACRHVEHQKDSVWYFTSIRRTAKYVLSH